MLIIINRKKKGKENYVLIKDFNTFRYNDTLHHRKFFFFLAVVLYKLLVQKKYENVILKTALKLMANKIL